MDFVFFTCEVGLCIFVFLRVRMVVHFRLFIFEVVGFSFSYL